MRARLTVIAALALSALVAPAAWADPPSRILIIAVFNPITYGEDAYINGQLQGKGQGSQAVELQESPPPFTDWTPVADTTADSGGFYSFQLRPSQTMQYRTVSQDVISQRAVQVSVAPRVNFSARPIGRTTIRFSGQFSPALFGETILIQRRGSFGSWVTVANPWLHNGSSFLGRIQARHRITLRAVFQPADNYLGAFSQPVVAVPRADATASRSSSCRAPAVGVITTQPAPLRAGAPMTLRVHAGMPGGKVASVDVRWGEGAKRDHFTLAPSYRKAHVTFTLHHRYSKPGTYVPTVKVSGTKAGCTRSSAQSRPRLTVVQ